MNEPLHVFNGHVCNGVAPGERHHDENGDDENNMQMVAARAGGEQAGLEHSSKNTHYHDHQNKQEELVSGNRSCLYNIKLPFPFKLSVMLDEVALRGEEEIISWLSNGKAFKVHQPKIFADLVMSRYFKQSKYKSFQRQLYLYGFQRINSLHSLPFSSLQSHNNKEEHEGDANQKDSLLVGAYYHKMFIRGDKNTCLHIPRQKKRRNNTFPSNAYDHVTRILDTTPLLPALLPDNSHLIPHSSLRSGDCGGILDLQNSLEQQEKEQRQKTKISKLYHELLQHQEQKEGGGGRQQIFYAPNNKNGEDDKNTEIKSILKDGKQPSDFNYHQCFDEGKSVVLPNINNHSDYYDRHHISYCYSNSPEHEEHNRTKGLMKMPSYTSHTNNYEEIPREYLNSTILLGQQEEQQRPKESQKQEEIVPISISTVELTSSSTSLSDKNNDGIMMDSEPYYQYHSQEEQQRRLSLHPLLSSYLWTSSSIKDNNANTIYSGRNICSSISVEESGVFYFFEGKKYYDV